MKDLEEKYDNLREYIQSLGSVAVAFSGGVDSTFLLRVAYIVLGDKAVAVTARSCSFPDRELNESKKFTKSNGIKHIFVDSEELDIKGFSENPTNRCYLCKRELFNKIKKVAQDQGLSQVIEGSNVDDLGDYRPGLEAIEELDVKSPLRIVGLAKEEIRQLSKELGLATWDKQSFACLSSRFPYGQSITPEKLKMVDQAEQVLLDLGFRQVRVRHHGALARIEIAEDEFDIIIRKGTRNLIYNKLKKVGFTYIALDMLGYRTGSMNETLQQVKY